MKELLKFAPFALVLFVVGCATIISGTKQDVSINSSPASAKVVVKTTGGLIVFTGTTPATCKLPRKEEYIVYINMAGFNEQQVTIGQSFNGWVIGNLACGGGVLGLVIDAVNGAMWNLKPQTIQVELSTAYLDGEIQHYAIFGALDDSGQLRTLMVPLIPEPAQD